MSDYENIKGKLTKIELGNLTLEEKCKEIIISKGKKLSLYDTYKEELMDTFYENYILIDNELYEKQSENLGDYGDCFCHITKNEDGSFNYVTRFYNGGTCENEMLEESLLEFLKENN